MADSQSYNSVTHNLTIEQKEYAAKVLNETDENRENAIAEIKCWIQESDLRARTDDFFILQFLRVCKFNIEKTKIKLENFQKLRVNRPEFYGNRDPMLPKLQELLDLGVFLPLRKLDDQGRLVAIVRFVYDPSKFSLSDIFKISAMIIDVSMRDSAALSLYGYVAIIDLDSMTSRHIAQMGPRIAMNMVYALQGCYPLRIPSINFINVSELTKIILRIVRYFLNDKLKRRMCVYSHTTTCDCLKNMPANILPVEYGGTDGTIKELTEYWKKVIEDSRNWFIDDEKYKPVLKKK